MAVPFGAHVPVAVCPGARCQEEQLVLWELGFYGAGRKHGRVAASLLYSLLTGTRCELGFSLVKGDSLRGTRITHRLFRSLSCEVYFFKGGLAGGPGDGISLGWSAWCSHVVNFPHLEGPEGSIETPEVLCLFHKQEQSYF